MHKKTGKLHIGQAGDAEPPSQASSCATFCLPSTALPKKHSRFYKRAATIVQPLMILACRVLCHHHDNDAVSPFVTESTAFKSRLAAA